MVELYIELLIRQHGLFSVIKLRVLVEIDCWRSERTERSDGTDLQSACDPCGYTVAVWFFVVVGFLCC